MPEPTYDELSAEFGKLLDEREEWRRNIREMGAEIEHLRRERDVLAAQKHAVLAICGPTKRPVMSNVIRRMYTVDPRGNVPINGDWSLADLRPAEAPEDVGEPLSRRCRDDDELVHPAYPHGCDQRVQLSAEVVSQTWPGCRCTWSLFTDTAPATVGITGQHPDCKVHPTPKEKA